LINPNPWARIALKGYKTVATIILSKVFRTDLCVKISKATNYTA